MQAPSTTGFARLCALLPSRVTHFAYAGGEGAARLVAHLGPSLERLDGHGSDAAMAALGAAAAGARVALLASGEAVFACLAALEQWCALGLPGLLLVPSHGADRGGTLPAASCADLRSLAALPLPVYVAPSPASVGRLLALATQHRGGPAALAVPLSAAGLARELEEPTAALFPSEARCGLVALGGAARGAYALARAREGLRVYALERWRPAPWEECFAQGVPASLLVHEPLPEPGDPTEGGALSRSLRAWLHERACARPEEHPSRVRSFESEGATGAAWAAALEVAEGRAPWEPGAPLRCEPHPLRALAGEARLEVRAGPERGEALLERVLSLAPGACVAPPEATFLRAVLPLPAGRSAQRVLLGEGGSWEPGTLAALPEGTVVHTAEDAPAAALETLRVACEVRGGALAHVHCQGGVEAALESLLESLRG